MMSFRPAALIHRSLFAILILALVAGCGFHMRGANGAYNLPFATVYLTLGENSSIGAEIRRNIRAYPGTEVVSDPKMAQAIIEVLGESRDKTILTINSQGLVREYSLAYTLRFRVKDNRERELLEPTSIVVKRSLSYNETSVLGKESEEKLLYRDMQTDLVQQMLRRLAAIHVTPLSVAPPAPAAGAK